MKRFVAKCPVSDMAIIVAVGETVVLPADGTFVSIPCPACHVQHYVQVRDPRHLRQAS